MNYQEYEEKCERLKEKNYEYINLFQSELIQQGLSTKTINKHTANVDFYLNEFLLWSEPKTMSEGCVEISEYLGYFFIRKCMWSTPASIRNNASSLKKFYKCMLSYGEIEKEQYEEMCETIRYGLDDWIADCKQYNDISQPNPFDIFG